MSASSGPGPVGLRRVLPTLAVLTLLLAPWGSGLFSQPAGATTPGAPGVVQPGTPIFTEDFENGSTTTPLGAQTYSAPGSTTYVGAGGQTYTGSPSWIDASRCNGVILSNANSTVPAWAVSGSSASGTTSRCSEDPGVKSYQFLRVLAQGMGQQFNPGSPTTDHVYTSYTECRSTGPSGSAVCDVIPAGPTHGVMFQTVNPIPVIPGHYYTFGVDTAYLNCGAGAGDPSYQFAWTDAAGVAHPIGAPLNGCQSTSDPNVTVHNQSVTADIGGDFGTVTRTVRISSMLTNQSFQASTTSLGIKIWNNNGTTNGNDGAFDNVRLVDVTPQLDTAFSPAVIAPGGTSTLTLAVTNTSERDAKVDWSITDALPTGLTIASTPNLGGTCQDTPAVGAPFVATAVPGSGQVSVSGGDLAAGQASCTITVDVTASLEGGYTNGPANVTTNLNPPGPATLVVRAPRITVTKALSAPRQAGTDQFTVEIRQGGASGAVVNDTSSSTTAGTGSTVTAGTGTTRRYVATAGTAYTLAETAAGTTSLAQYRSTITCTDSTNLQGGLPTGAAFDPQAPPVITPVAGADISCTLTNAARPLVNAAKQGGAVTGPDAAGNYRATYAVTVTNSGSVAGTYGPLTDTPAFASNLAVTGATWTASGAGAPAARSSSTSGPYILAPAGTALGAGATHTYTVTVTYHHTDTTQATPCSSSGTGLFNSVSTPGEDGPTSDNDACDTPPPPPAPAISLAKSASITTDGNGDGRAGVGDEITFSLAVKNTGSVTLHDITVADQLVAPAGPAVSVECPPGVVAPGQTITCTSSGYVVTQADVDAGSVANTATVSGTPPSGPPVVSPPASATILTPGSPGIRITRSVLLDDANDDGLAGVGEAIVYVFDVENTGDVTLHDVTVDDPMLRRLDLSVSCPSEVLAPGESMVCESPAYVVTKADLDSGAVSSLATQGVQNATGDGITSRSSWVDVVTGEAWARGSLAFTGTTVLAAASLGLALLLGGAALLFLGRRRHS